MKRFISLLMVVGAICMANAAIESVNLSGWTGTVFRNGWFTYLLPDVYSDTGAVRLEGDKPFLLSPTYNRPIRKVIMSVWCATEAPARGLVVSPFVNGVESADPSLTRTLVRSTQAGKFEYVHFDWPVSDSVTAIRIHLSSGSSGSWGVGEVHVCSGDRDDKEDALISRLTNALPPPANPTIVDFTESSLMAAADPVATAAGYRFELFRLDGLPRRECREDFANAPAVSSDWTLEYENAVLSDGGKSYSDKKSSVDESALKVEKPVATNAQVRVTVTSPTVEAAIVRYSFVCRIGTKGKSDRFAVEGRTPGSDAWRTVCAAFEPDVSGSNRYCDFLLDATNDIRQVRFVFTADGHDFTVAGLDSLCLVSGGDEKRTSVMRSEPQAVSTNLFTDLPVGRYVFKAQSVADPGATVGDSVWSEESPVIDLGAAGIEMTAPQGIMVQAAGETLTVSWSAVDGADHYLLSVAAEDDPEAFLVSDMKVNGTSETVIVPAVGNYAVWVTAVAPCNKSRAVSESVRSEVRLGDLGTVKAEAVDKRTIVATWNEIPLAEGYQATLVRINGNNWTDFPDFSSLPDVWPEGWTHYSFDKSKYAGPVPKLQYARSWVETRTYPQPVTEVVLKVKSHVTAAAFAEEIGRTFVVVAGSRSDSGEGDWQTIASHPVTTSMQAFVDSIPYSSGFLRLRFSVDYRGEDPNYGTAVNLELNVRSVTCGQERQTDEQSVRTETGAVTFRDLDPEGRYRVAVIPQPSEDGVNGTASAVVNLSAERFRDRGAVPLSSLRGGRYEEDFSVLSNMMATVDIRKTDLDHWQFYKGSGEAGQLAYVVGTNRASTGGVYVCRDSGKGTDELMLGTLATGSAGCSVGIAFRNDLDYPVALTSLSFDRIQRTLRTNASVHSVEWLLTDGAEEIGTTGDWRPFPSAAYVSEKEPADEVVMPVVRAVGITDDLPPKIPAGGVLILRWRHEKVSSGPLMAIDNVKAEFSCSRGFCVIVR